MFYAGIAILLSGCDTVRAIGQSVDNVCVVGKLTTADAVMLNANHPKWQPPAKVDDRVVNGDCSVAIRSVTQPE